MGLKTRAKLQGVTGTVIPDSVRKLVVEVALDRPDLTPRELAWHITDIHDYYVSESSIYRILKAHDLITSPQFTAMSASDKFQHPTGQVHELWQTGFTYSRGIGWSWYFLSAILDGYLRIMDLVTSVASCRIGRRSRIRAYPWCPVSPADSG